MPDDFLKFNNGKKINLSNFQEELKKGELSNAELEELFNIFDGVVDGQID